MTNKPKNIGTAAETAVVRVLQASGWPYAERRTLHGSYDRGDVTGTPGVVWEVKGGEAAKSASDGLIEAWLLETETERVNDNAAVGVLVVQRRGIGPANAKRWWAVMRSETLGGAFMTIDHMPVRLTLEGACRVLVGMGYGSNPMTAQEAIA